MASIGSAEAGRSAVKFDAPIARTFFAILDQVGMRPVRQGLYRVKRGPVNTRRLMQALPS